MVKKKKVVNDEVDLLKEKTCFVIMPYGDMHDVYYFDVYAPAIEAKGLVARRADDVYRQRTILQSVWLHIQRASVILADLTEHNQNVFYELGLAHAATKPAILVTDNIENVPVDLRSVTLITYSKKHPSWGNDLREKIERALDSVLSNPEESILLGGEAESGSIGELVHLRNERRGGREIAGIIQSYFRIGRTTDEVFELLKPLGLSRAFVEIEHDKFNVRDNGESGDGA